MLTRPKNLKIQQTKNEAPAALWNAETCKNKKISSLSKMQMQLTWTHGTTLTKRDVFVLALDLRAKNPRTCVLAAKISLARDRSLVAGTSCTGLGFETLAVSVRPTLKFAVGAVVYVVV